MNAEQARLDEADERGVAWRQWGPYLSERQWGTVREDYSEHGNAWEYFPHDHARSRAYRWGEDGLAGISDDRQRLCFALALWNGKDPILKERLFGLTNSEGNHGEDVKEYYFYLDSTPTHSYMKYLYKYPQAAFPYADLVHTNRGRSREWREYELLDTGVFDDDRYFDVFVEYAKQSPQDILVRITVCNRGPEAAVLHVLPTLWFRNTWTWEPGAARPALRGVEATGSCRVVEASHDGLGKRYLYCDASPPLLFTENETNSERIFGTPNRSPYVKDAIDRYLLHGQHDAVNPAQTGTKVVALYPLTVGSGQTRTLWLRLSNHAPGELAATSVAMPFGEGFEAAMTARQREADEFYDAITPASFTADEARVMRQALAGMLWSKQFFYYDLNRWLKERGAGPLGSSEKTVSRNAHWYHMVNSDVVSMPDKWEYPWYAAWDLAFHVLALSMVDASFSKQQLSLMLHRRYLHPNGQIPAYEWSFSDVNPPVHAWATMFTYQLDKASRGTGDIEWLERSFQKLAMNFTWWVNRKDRDGRNVFEGGFLGLDNIGVFDRSAPLPTGGHLEQADGTAWMALFSLNMLEIALELSRSRPIYVDMAQKFFEHFMWIAAAMNHVGGGEGLWDEQDGFFYDVLRLPDGRAHRLKIRSIVGLLPLCAVWVYKRQELAHVPDLGERARRFLAARPELIINMADPRRPGCGDRRLMSVLDEQRLRRVLETMLNEGEFLSPYGIRSLSRYHADHPYVLQVQGREFRVDYRPAESNTGVFGGNSNWRGPVWMPLNVMIIRALLQYHLYYGDDFTVECPTGSGRRLTLFDVAHEISKRLTAIFLRDVSPGSGQTGRRPVYGGTAKFQEDPHWRDYILFYEYFHGDNGAGIGASHQTGWTGVVARLMHLFATVNGREFLALESKEAGFRALSASGAADARAGNFPVEPRGPAR